MKGELLSQNPRKNISTDHGLANSGLFCTKCYTEGLDCLTFYKMFKMFIEVHLQDRQEQCTSILNTIALLFWSAKHCGLYLVGH